MYLNRIWTEGLGTLKGYVVHLGSNAGKILSVTYAPHSFGTLDILSLDPAEFSQGELFSDHQDVDLYLQDSVQACRFGSEGADKRWILRPRLHFARKGDTPINLTINGLGRAREATRRRISRLIRLIAGKDSGKLALFIEPNGSSTNRHLIGSGERIEIDSVYTHGID